MPPLEGQLALVTGGTRRLGREIALALARQGAAVAITYRSSRDEAQSVVEEIVGISGHAGAYKCDVRDPATIRETVEKIRTHHRRLDILVNNAGAFTTGNFDQVRLEDWDLMFETNVRGAFLMSQAGLPLLRKNGGRIIHIGSLGGIRAWATHAPYCASKAALHMLTQVMAKALAPKISVNCVAPGMVDMGGGDREECARFAAKTPMKRNATPDDVCSAVLHFATASQFITGQIMAVDGGLGL